MKFDRNRLRVHVLKVLVQHHDKFLSATEIAKLVAPQDPAKNRSGNVRDVCEWLVSKALAQEVRIGRRRKWKSEVWP